MRSTNQSQKSQSYDHKAIASNKVLCLDLARFLALVDPDLLIEMAQFLQFRKDFLDDPVRTFFDKPDRYYLLQHERKNNSKK